jgi:hypothetical protein
VKLGRFGANVWKLRFGTDENMYYLDNVPNGTQDEVHETLYKSDSSQNQIDESMRRAL